MTPEERIINMTKAINQAIKVMADRFGSTESDVARAIQENEGVDAGVIVTVAPALEPMSRFRVAGLARAWVPTMKKTWRTI